MSQTGETVSYSLEAVLTRFEGKLDNLQRDVTDIKIGMIEVKGEIKALDERLTGKIEALDECLSGEIEALDDRLTTGIQGLDERVKNQEFTGRERDVGKPRVFRPRRNDDTSEFIRLQDSPNLL
jgi:hypothetical protein